MVRATVFAALIVLAGCGHNPPQRCEPEVEIVETKIPYREVREVPANLAEPYRPDAIPQWVQPEGSDLICVAPDEFRKLQRINHDHLRRDDEWRQWADVEDDNPE